ncbi:MAG: hypothetical protein U0992_13775 [Planctomycetaceae bacterium]
MPAFAADPAHPALNLLTPADLNLLVSWLRGEWYEPPNSTGAAPSQSISSLVRR